jgi:uncharacterized protein (TIGR03118 family)
MTFPLSTWLRAMKRNAATGSPARRTKRTHPNRIVLRLETLEDRTVPSAPGAGPPAVYVQTNLVSDIPGLAQLTDPSLKNPWGTSFSADSSFSVSDQKTNVSTLYAVTEAGVSQESPTIAIPTTAAGPQGPTGQARNDTSSFLVNGTPASFIYANLNGTISAWNSSAGTTAQVEVTTSGAAAYPGLVLQSTAAGDFLYAANVKQGRIDVYNGSWALTSLGPNAFVDPLLPGGLVPFNVEDVNGDLYVAYALAGPRAVRESASEGAGVVAVFDTSGNFIKQLISGSKLASPWGITVAPSSFGKFGGDLLVGNFSYVATEINAFDPVSGAYLGTLTDSSGNTLLKGDNGLWDLTFGIGRQGGLPDILYFVTGLNAETDGLFGAITPAPRPGIAVGIAGRADGLNIAFTDLSQIVMAGNQAAGGAAGDQSIGAGSSQATTPPAAMVWSGQATTLQNVPAAAIEPAAQMLQTMAGSLTQDAIDQLFAGLASGEDANWII